MARLKQSQRDMPNHIAILQGGEISLVVLGKEGSSPFPVQVSTIEEADAHVLKAYGDRAPSPAEREAAAVAAAWGWSHAGADPRVWMPRGR